MGRKGRRRKEILGGKGPLATNHFFLGFDCNNARSRLSGCPPPSAVPCRPKLRCSSSSSSEGAEGQCTDGAARRRVAAGSNTRVGEISFPDNHLTVLCVASVVSVAVKEAEEPTSLQLLRVRGRCTAA